MKIAFVADAHIGNHRRFGGRSIASINQRCKFALDVYSNALNEAMRLGAEHLIVLGDLLDVARPEPSVLRAVQRETAAARKGGLKTTFMRGNHEQTSSDAGDHALAPLWECAKIVERPEVMSLGDVDLLLVPYEPGEAGKIIGAAVQEATWRDAEVGAKHRIVGFHAGVRDEQTAPWLREAHDAIDVGRLRSLLIEANVRWALAGNWHDHRRWTSVHGGAERDIVQLGALIPTGFDNPGLDGYGGFALFDSEAAKVARRELPGPRFVKLGPADKIDAAIKAAANKGHRLFVEWTVYPEDLSKAREVLDALAATGAIHAADVVLSRGQAEADARDAAVTARSAETFAEALANFVEAMPLDEGVDRAEVLQIAQRFLSGAKR